MSTRDSRLSRRTFLTATAGAAVAAGTHGALARDAATVQHHLPAPAHSGLDHIVVVCMENRSFDHYLGWVRGADGTQAGLHYPDDHGVLHPTHHLTDRQGCGFNDPDHSVEGGALQYNAGRLDGFRRGSNDDFALGYYEASDLPLYGPLIPQAMTFDRYFCSILGPTYPNRFYTHAATTDRLENTMTLSDLPTIWDRLTDAGVSATYYYSDLPFLGLFGPKYLPMAQPVSTFFAQAASGTLPSYSYLDPFFLGEDQGGSNDDHPHADIHRGQAFLSTVVRAVTQSPLWERTALVITYDEWGGFFDHVAPPLLPDATQAPATKAGVSRSGFRVPCIVVSPFAQRGRVRHATYDHTSILRMVEWRWKLKPLTARDASARNLAKALDFSRPNLTPPDVPLVLDPGPHVCGAPGVGMAAEDPMWVALRDVARRHRWDVG
jgi:phospholipase C